MSQVRRPLGRFARLPAVDQTSGGGQRKHRARARLRRMDGQLEK
jgi:hypothetical protein